MPIDELNNQDNDTELTTFHDIEEDERRRAAIQMNKKMDASAGAIDGLALSGIFTFHLTDALKEIFATTAKLVFFPLAAILAVTRFIFAAREAYLQNGKHGTAVKAVVEGIAAVAITTAVVGGLFLWTASTLVSPLIFISTLAAKTLFHAGASIYYGIRSFLTGREIKKLDNVKLSEIDTAHLQRRAELVQKQAEQSKNAKEHGIGAGILALTTVAVGLVLVLGGPVVGKVMLGIGIGLGIAAGLFIAANSIRSFFGGKPAAPKGYIPVPQEAPSETEKERIKNKPSIRSTHALVGEHIPVATKEEAPLPAFVPPSTPPIAIPTSNRRDTSYQDRPAVSYSSSN